MAARPAAMSAAGAALALPCPWLHAWSACTTKQLESALGHSAKKQGEERRGEERRGEENSVKAEPEMPDMQNRMDFAAHGWHSTSADQTNAELQLRLRPGM